MNDDTAQINDINAYYGENVLTKVNVDLDLSIRCGHAEFYNAHPGDGWMTDYLTICLQSTEVTIYINRGQKDHFWSENKEEFSNLSNEIKRLLVEKDKIDGELKKFSERNGTWISSVLTKNIFSQLLHIVDKISCLHEFKFEIRTGGYLR